MQSATRGFTLLELMITLTVFAIIAVVAIPNFQNYMLQNRVKTGAQELFTSLLYARSEAVKRDAPVYVIPADPDAWHEGWIVTNETSRTYAECDGGGASDCLRLHQPLSGLAVTSAEDEVVYSGNGRTESSTEFRFCTEQSNAAVQERSVATELSGMPRIRYEGDCS
jgi:type IV fimbrial biogenesis protein FimT